MEENYEEVSLSNILNGALEEKFKLEVQKVMSNIADPNVKRGSVRTIAIKLKIKPEYDSNGKLLYHRTIANVTSDVPGYEGVEGALHSYKQKGEYKLVQEKSTPGELFQTESDNSTVKQIKEVNN